jgi:uncharacterized protein
MTAAAPRPTTHLLYLHGFRSSPQSFKARRVQAWLAERHPDLRFWCPQLPPSPREAIALVEAGVTGWPEATSAVMGSSLGGFYAHVVAGTPGREAWRCVLLNPAVEPARDLAAHIGEQRQFHDPAQHFYFRPEFVDELRALAPGPLRHPQRCLALLAKGDEVLDWREMSRRHADARQILLEGSDHALSDFDDHLPSLMRFLQLCD